MSKDGQTAPGAANAGASFRAAEVSSNPGAAVGESQVLGNEAGQDLVNATTARRLVRVESPDQSARTMQRFGPNQPQFEDSGMEPPIVTDGYTQYYSAAAQLGVGERNGTAELNRQTRAGEPDLYAFTGDENAAAGKLDSKKSVGELLADASLQGRMRIADQPADPSDAQRQADKLKEGEAPKITVMYSDESDNPNKPQPDFIVKKDGTIQVVNDPERNPDREIVVVLERNKGESGAPPEAQQKAADELVDYLGQRITDKYNLPTIDVKDGDTVKKVEQVSISDPQNLISDAVEQKFGGALPPESVQSDQPMPSVPQNVQDLSDQIGRIQGSGGSRSFDRGAVDSNFTPTEVSPPQNEVAGVHAVKDTIASFTRADKGYDTVQRRSNGSYGVGRYGINFGLFGGWIEDLLGIDLGDPPDMNKLRELLKKNPALRQKLAAAMQKMAKGGDDGKGGKIPQEFADKFKVDAEGNFENQNFVDGFMRFGDNLQGGKGEITNADVHNFLPKELQENIVQDRIENYARQFGVADPDKMTAQDAGKIGLAMYLGRTPSEEDLNNPAYKKYTEAFGNMYTVAKARTQNLGDITITDGQGKILASAKQSVGQALWAQGDFRNVVQGGNLGCAASVSEPLQAAGFTYANSAGVGNLTKQLTDHGWTRHPVSQAQPGDVVYGWEPGTNLYAGGGGAHIGIVGENGSVYHNSSSRKYWVNDSLNGVFNSRRFGNQIYVLRPPENRSSAA